MPVKPATPSAVLQVGTTEVRLWELPFSIGRSSKNTLTIRDRHLSRSHCEIDQTSDGFAIRNLSTSEPFNFAVSQLPNLLTLQLPTSHFRLFHFSPFHTYDFFGVSTFRPFDFSPFPLSR